MRGIGGGGPGTGGVAEGARAVSRGTRAVSAASGGTPEHARRSRTRSETPGVHGGVRAGSETSVGTSKSACLPPDTFGVSEEDVAGAGAGGGAAAGAGVRGRA